MTNYYSIIKADYLQRFRSYTFMVTLCVSVIIAYTFVPVENASYTTIHAGKYVGFNNAAWIGHVTAIMASTFLWLIGFYIINNGISRDKETGVGQIIATTSISNFQYLLAKSLSNFLVLLTIMATIFLMALGLIITRASGYQFNAGQFLFPYLFATVPSLFFLSVLAVVFEVIFGKRTNLSNVVFFFVFAAIASITNAGRYTNLTWLDPLGIKFLTNEILAFVNTSFAEKDVAISVGFNFNAASEVKHFLYPGSDFNASYIASRLMWIVLAFVLIRVSANFFNRFDTKFVAAHKIKKLSLPNAVSQPGMGEIKPGSLAKAATDFGIFPLFKTEFMMLLRKGPKWFWMINAGIFIALAFMPLDIALKIGVPIFWFLQVNRWADLSTKEKFFGTDKFVYATYKPLQRLLVSQILAGVMLAVLLALPVLLRLMLQPEVIIAFEVMLGAIILISFSVCSGIVWGGKRFFEIFFFMITYFVIQGFYFLDYWGSNHKSMPYMFLQIIISTAFLCIAFFTRQHTIKKQ